MNFIIQKFYLKNDFKFQKYPFNKNLKEIYDNHSHFCRSLLKEIFFMLEHSIIQYLELKTKLNIIIHENSSQCSTTINT